MRHITATGYKIIARAIKKEIDYTKSESYLSNEQRECKLSAIRGIIYYLNEEFEKSPKYRSDKFYLPLRQEVEN